MMNWTDWLAFETRPNHFGAAVYRLRLVVGNKPVPIPRLLGVDHDGLLVVGQTSNMNQRHIQSLSARKSANGSSTMNLLYYWERFTELPRRFPGFGYEYQFVPVESVDVAKAHEAQLIKQYVCRFADRPPLNSVLPDRYAGWQEAIEAFPT